ncbi:MAG TPA: ribonuclease HII [Candidatus Sulfotelmatobacter sp.]|jgi:ribonuclease HII|nr:ribonuclease HII [Candidatus Sulfotelmatobacter sp.]
MPDLSLELACKGSVCGVDEVGRGPLAGPVVACAVILPPNPHPRLRGELDDSKKLSVKKREALFELIMAEAVVGLGRAEVEEIDRLNILKATFLAMRRAVEGLGRAVDTALVDGNQIPQLPVKRVQCVVKGDGKSLSIAAASVVAKVSRDREMSELSQCFPGYGWERNAGYGTAEHRAAMQRLGLTEHHRKSFAPVADLFRNL